MHMKNDIKCHMNENLHTIKYEEKKKSNFQKFENKPFQNTKIELVQ